MHEKLNWKHTEKVEYLYHQVVFKMHAPGLMMSQGTTEEHMEENTGGDGKVEDDVDRNGEKGSRSCGEAGWLMFLNESKAKKKNYTTTQDF